MATIPLACDEWYPVYTEADYGNPTDLPDDMLDRLRATTEAFLASQREVRKVLAAQQQAELERRRAEERAKKIAERGQRRPRRRPHPERAARTGDPHANQDHG